MRQIRVCVWLVVALSVLPSLPIWGLPEAVAGKCPRVAVLLDKSGSMAEDPNGQNPPAMGQVSKWETATNTIRAKIVNPYHLRLPLGLALFPGAAMCVQDPFKVRMDYNQKNAIEPALMGESPGGGTPMCIAVTAVAGDMGFKDPEHANFIILVTDGAPNDCCGADPVSQTEQAIKDAANQVPPVYTFVIGFGDLAVQHDALNRLGAAGGVSARKYGQMQDYYKARDAAGLEKALDQVMAVITGGDAGNKDNFCDDTCYHNACSGKDQVCINGECKANPCTGYSCPMGQYCYTDGKSRSCATPCAMSCPSGKGCNPKTGMCDADPCSGKCGDREMCSMGACVPGPACAEPCKLGQQCRGGACVEEPCRYISCPGGYQCEPYSGACTPLLKLTPFVPPRTMPRTAEPLPPVPSGEAVQGGWCATTQRAAGSRSTEGALAGLFLMIGLLLLRRRPRGAGAEPSS